MKKINLLFGLAIALFMFTNCDKKIETSPLQLDSSNLTTTTVSVYLDGEYNLSTAGDEAIPDGNVVVFTVSNDEILDLAEGSQVITATTEGGYATVELPVNANGDNTTFSIEVEDFMYDQIQGDGSTLSKKYSYTLGSYTANLGVDKKIEATASYTAIADEFATATIKGKFFYYDLISTGAGGDYIKTYPNGQKVLVTSSNPDFEKVVTLDSKGEFTLSVSIYSNGTSDYKAEIVPFDIKLQVTDGTMTGTDYNYDEKDYRADATSVSFNNLAPKEVRYSNSGSASQIGMTAQAWN